MFLFLFLIHAGNHSVLKHLKRGKMLPVVPGPDVFPLRTFLLLARTPKTRSPLSEAASAELNCS